MKRLMLYIASVMLIGSQACEKDPTFNFRGEDRIYFSYPKELDRWGNETDRELDSIVYTFVSLPAEVVDDTIWLKVKRVGERAEVDKSYAVSVVADSSTAVEGVDFESLKPSYVFRKNLGVDSFPLIVCREHLKTVPSKNILLTLEATPDFDIGFVEYKNIRINISDYLPRPGDWDYIEGFLGEYHYLKYEKWIEMTGSMQIGERPNSYRNYYANLIKDYFNTHTILDPITGDRVTCNL